ncbi:hypothetical protein [Mitsuokella sp. AF21-1AC]|uniref:hypothetical protein n=1 Tax=Mitsuokella sp. AF21-1AC TaxID=2292235 RepID=UPI0011C7305E|nr:hypothetical protein [Mitsuokella sp. AF21-1AC]
MERWRLALRRDFFLSSFLTNVRRSSSARFVHSSGFIKKEKIPLASRLRAMLLPHSRLFAFSCVLKPEGILCFATVRGEGKKMGL